MRTEPEESVERATGKVELLSADRSWWVGTQPHRMSTHGMAVLIDHLHGDHVAGRAAHGSP